MPIGSQTCKSVVATCVVGGMRNVAGELKETGQRLLATHTIVLLRVEHWRLELVVADRHLAKQQPGLMFGFHILRAP